ncbi:IS66 family insertion sequence element accessory protein TnpA [Undibacterium sp. Tian12W]|uniref:IS66 family insertion sequence element accessory protein TnpA n=1 Tax=Undibacterium sp. Tian12W TaxID=3413054 RepID=UPI003BF11458
MTREERRTLWQERINQWQQSGLRLAAFSRHHELDIKRLAYWRTRLKSIALESAHQTLDPLRIQPVSPQVDASAPSAMEGCLSITSPGGWHITLPTTLPVAWLGELLGHLP